MSSVPTRRHRHSIGVNRRELLQVGYSGLLGVGLSSLGVRAALGQTKPKAAKSVIIVFLTGAASHHDTFDMKPEAPPEIRGEFKPIATKVPGLHVCEHLPRLAARADKYAVVRSLSHRENNHLVATHHVLTGHQMPGAFFDKVASRDDWPSYSSARDYLRPRNDGVPSGVNLPTFLMEGPLTWPGQHAGFLGPKHDPGRSRAIRMPPISAWTASRSHRESRSVASKTGGRCSTRSTGSRCSFADAAEARRLSEQQQLAFSVLTSGKIAHAFDMDREPAMVRERYGRHAFGQSLLLARRLVEAGVPVVQANMGRVQNWDHHGNIFPTLKGKLLPPLDQGRRRPARRPRGARPARRDAGDDARRIWPDAEDLRNAGRDHWGPCFFGLFAGAGVRGGQVIGRSDKIGAYPATTPYSPDDVGATVYHVLGIDPESEVRDRQNRPVQLNRGTVMEALFTGAAG